MAYGRVNVGSAKGGGGDGIGTTMVISQTHKGDEAPTGSPLQLGYYQNIFAGADFSKVSLKSNGTEVATAKSVYDRNKLELAWGGSLAGAATYDVEVPFGAVKDVLGNVLKGVYKYSFKTEDRPIYLVTPEATKEAFDKIIANINLVGGTVYFSEGEFRGLFPITITHSDVELIGEGNNTKIICDTPYSGTYVGVIGVIGTAEIPVENVTIKNMLIDGDYSSDKANRNYYGIRLINTNNSEITGNIAQNNSSRGISLFNSSNNNTITGNTVQNNGTGIYLSISSNNTITGNTFQNNLTSGITLADLSSNNTITGNTSQNNGNHGIYLHNSINNTITGNTSQNNSIDGIHLSSSSKNNTVTGNTAQNNSSRGISLFNSSNTTITGNTSQNNGTYGIELHSSSNNIILLANKYTSISNSGTNTIISQNIVQP